MNKRKPKKSSKEQKVQENLQRVTKQFLMGKSYAPMSETELFKRLGLPELHRDLFSRVLQKLCEAGEVEKKGKLYHFPRTEDDVVTGVLRVHPRGFGFLQPDVAFDFSGDVFIPKHLTMNAVDGDRVEVVVNYESVSDKGPEGRVINILTSARSHVAGTVLEMLPDGQARAYVPLLGTSARVIVDYPPKTEVVVGDRIVMHVKEWGGKDEETHCDLMHKIGHIDDPSCDVPAAVEEFSLRDQFPVATLSQARSYGTRVTPKDMEGRRDLREQMTFTIDPDTAKDFDDAISLSKDDKGRYHLDVHIADVSHYVSKGSPIDREAYLRSNSTYFPGTVVPMLPEALSNNLCSLKPNVIRLAVTVSMILDGDGALKSYEIFRSVIKSQKRFTYRQAKDVLDGKLKSPLKPNLDLMVELCGKLKKVRYERGSIEFALPELVVLVDEKGKPTGTDFVEYDVTHQMIEEFMLKANEVVATHLSENGHDFAYRIHDEPANENLREFALVAAAFGYKVSAQPTLDELQTLFDEAQHTPYGSYLASNFIRRMKMAYYSAENIGHYGLALTHYCHFTSPIRRYADLIVHRVLFGDEETFERVEEMTARCSERERISSRAESTVTLLKKLRLLKEMTEADPHREFEGVVTKVKPFGFFFEVIDLMCEGFIHI
ncbi:MAG: VacB/RNase II family 3'-5' exoribonuclease, partial [Chlamydiia bacterium]|nr:VacB/RNase II family 3'-5' exoribonuclease [Chlamydiia bacterium]